MVELRRTTNQSHVLQKAKSANHLGDSTISLVYATVTHVLYMTTLKKKTHGAQNPKDYLCAHTLDETMFTLSEDSSDEYVYAMESQQCKEQVQSTGAVKEIFQITRPKNTVTVGHYCLGVIIDSGASVNVIDKKDFDQLVQQNNKITLQKANAEVFAYGEEKPLPLVGAFEATVKSVTCSTAATCCKW